MKVYSHTSTHPLLADDSKLLLHNYEKSALSDFIIAKLSNDPAFNVTHACIPVCLKVILSIGGFLGRIPLLPLSLKFQAQIPFIGITCAATNFVSYSSYLVWASCNMVDQIARDLFFSKDKKNCCDRIKKTSLLAINIINGVFAQIPYFILSWDYNPAAPYLVALNAMDVTLPIYSLFLMTEQIGRRLNKSQRALKLAAIKNDLVFQCQNLLTHMIQGTQNDSLTFFEKLTKVNDEDLQLNMFLMHLAVFKTMPTQVNRQTNCMIKTAKTLGIILMLVQAAWYGFLSYQGTSKLISNDAVNTLIAAYVVVCNIALVHFVLVNASSSFLNGCSTVFQKKSKPSFLSENLAPLSSRLLKLACVILALTAFVPAIQMTEDYLNDKLFWPSSILYGLGFALMDYYPMRALSDDFMLTILKRFGTEQSKLMIKTYNKILDVKEAFNASNHNSIREFLIKNSHLHTISTLLEKHNLDFEELESF